LGEIPGWKLISRKVTVPDKERYGNLVKGVGELKFHGVWPGENIGRGLGLNLRQGQLPRKAHLVGGKAGSQKRNGGQGTSEPDIKLAHGGTKRVTWRSSRAHGTQPRGRGTFPIE